MVTVIDEISVLIGDIALPNGEVLRQNLRVLSAEKAQNRMILSLEIAPEAIKLIKSTEARIVERLKAHYSVEQVLIAFTAEKQRESKHGRAFSSLQQVGQIIAIASGKGGVGKSTTTANLAMALQGQGYKVGILDADIYGPSVPKLFGLEGRSPEKNEMIEPLDAYGIKVMSIGFMVPDGQPLIWRGPMLDKALVQLLGDVAWGKLDYLLIDMPPGTGDAHLSIIKHLELDGALLVSTPQDLALIDARKGLHLFREANVPVWGLIENMSYFLCPHCGAQCNIFSHAGLEQEAKREQIPFLGGIPLHITVRKAADSGMPLSLSAPESAEAKAYQAIAEKISRGISSNLRAANA